MSTHRLVTLAAVALVLSAPSLASASSLWHTATGEASDSFHPDHIKNTRTRAEVLQELDDARKDGSLRFLQLALPVPVRSSGPGKTRAEVQREVLNISAGERLQWQGIYGY